MMIIFVLMFSSQAQTGLDLNGFLLRVKAKHQGLKAIEVSKESVEEKKVAGDISLVPALTFKNNRIDDKKQPNFMGATSTLTDQYSLGLSKKFSTGTMVGLSATTTAIENKGMSSPLFSSFSKYSQGALGVSFSQSLWKDSFGQATRLRREREGFSSQLERNSLNLQERQLLIEAEALYWDHLYLKEELAKREESLKRAQRIENWTRRRVANGIGDRADSLNAQALVASRQLQLLATQDEMTANQKKIKDILELNENDFIPVLHGKIDLERNIKDTFRGKKRVLRLDAYLAELEAKTKGSAAKEVEDAYRADLTLSGSYNTNSYAAGGGYNEGMKDWNKTDTPTSTIAVSWTYLFDTDVKDAARSNARKEALAAELRRQRKTRESELAWTELVRRNDELTKKIEAARIIGRLQLDRALAENDKLNKGRSITANVITAEQDAAEAELTVIKLMAEQRKLESQSQMFIAPEEI